MVVLIDNKYLKAPGAIEDVNILLRQYADGAAPALVAGYRVEATDDDEGFVGSVWRRLSAGATIEIGTFCEDCGALGPHGNDGYCLDCSERRARA